MSELDEKQPLNVGISLETILEAEQKSPASSESETSQNSNDRVQEELVALTHNEFPDLSLEKRRSMITEWRARDLFCMQRENFKMFQFTNFVAEWRVSMGGAVTIRPHNSVRRRSIKTKELELLTSTPGMPNETFTKGSADISAGDHLINYSKDELAQSELENGGGSTHNFVPKIVVMARNRLVGL